ALTERLHQRIVEQHRGDQHAVNEAVVENLVNGAAFVLRVGQPEHDGVVERVARGRNTLNQQRKVWIGEEGRDARRNNQTKDLRASSGEAASSGVRLEVVALHDLQDALARFGAHVWVAVDDPRDGRAGNSGMLSDLFEGRGHWGFWERSHKVSKKNCDLPGK